jgi:hypothetical protein
MAVEPLGEEWVAGLVEASGRAVTPCIRSAVVEFTIGRKASTAVEIVDGRVVGPAGDAEPGLSVPVTADQLASFVDGSESMARAYMRGDLKPVGSTGALLAIISLFEDPAFRTALAAAVA